MKSYFVNPHVIFYFTDQGLTATDVLEKNTYVLDVNYFNRLIQWHTSRSLEITVQDQELKAENFLVDTPLVKGSWQGDNLSWLCHLAMRLPDSLTPSQSDEDVCQEMLQFAASKEGAPDRPPFIGTEIALPEPNLSLLQERDYFQVLKSRMTTRNFNAEPITIDQLSLLLFICFGYVHGESWDEIESLGVLNIGERKTSPSATGLQSCEAYIAAQFVCGLDKGLYRYNPKTHCLHLIRPGLENDEFKHMVCDQFWIRDAACGLLIVFDSNRVFIKHEGARALLVGDFEAGHLSQTILLTATAMGLKTWLTATLRDDYLTRVLQLESPRCHVLTFIALGHGRNDPVPDKIKRLLLEKTDDGVHDR